VFSNGWFAKKNSTGERKGPSDGVVSPGFEEPAGKRGKESFAGFGDENQKKNNAGNTVVENGGGRKNVNIILNRGVPPTP